MKVLLSSSDYMSVTSFGDLLDGVPEAARTDGLVALVEGLSLRCKTQYEASRAAERSRKSSLLDF